MNVSKQELAGCKLEISLSFEAGEVDAQFSKVYQELNDRGSVRGFRPGKAPRNILKRQFGQDTIRETAYYELLQDSFEEALDDTDVYGQPELPALDEVEFEEGEPAQFTVTVTVGPRVKVGDTGGMSLVAPNPEPQDHEIEKVLADLRESHAEEVQVERDVVHEGDAVDVELRVTTKDDEQEAEPVEETIIVGQGAHFPPIGDKLPGRMLEQSVEMDVTYPDDYHDESLAGQEAHIACVIKALRERQLPALDDEFAKMVDEERFSTLEDMRAEIRRQLGAERAKYSREEVETQITKALVERSEVDLPEVLVDTVAQRETSSMSDELSQMGLDVDGFRDMTGVSAEEFRRGQLLRARRLLTIQTILDELGKEYAEIAEDDITAEVERYAEEEGMAVDFVKQAAAVQPEFQTRMSDRVRRRRVFDAIIEQAQVEQADMDEYEKMREELLRMEEEAGEEPETASDDASPAQEPETPGEEPETASDDASPAQEPQAQAEDSPSGLTDDDGQGESAEEAVPPEA